MRRTSLALVALGAGAAAGYWFGWHQPRLTLPTPRPARDYPAALAQAATLTALDAGPLIPVCRTQIFDHGRRTPGAVVLFHGFTNCPAQFAALGEAFFRQGDNVVIVRLPRHGLEHRYVDELKQLTAEELLAAASAAVDVAAGLGERVTVLGLSLGGLLAGWQAQLRGDVDRAVLVAPALRFFTVPGRWQPFYARVLSWWPSFFYWWDPVAKTQGGGPAHAYPGFYSAGFAQVLRLGLLLQKAARQQPPRARQVTLVTNPCDEAVDNRGAAALAAAWRRHGAAVTEHAFPAAWGLPHDLIDPAQPTQQIARVYPRLLAWAAA